MSWRSGFRVDVATEKLAERHGLWLGVETVRRWIIANGMWRDRRERLASAAGVTVIARNTPAATPRKN